MESYIYYPDIMSNNLENDVLLTDLAEDNTYIDLFHEALIKIKNSKDSLKENYININPRSFISFPAVIKEGRIVCFSGVISDKDRWGTSIARASTRMWIDYDYRFTGLTKFTGGTQFMNTSYCLPLQIKKAKEHGIKCLFISREGDSSLGFEEYLKLIKINCGVDFKLLPEKYNTCGSLNIIPESCKQFIAIHSLTADGEDVWYQQMNINKI
jgi:hypothetical protein